MLWNRKKEIDLEIAQKAMNIMEAAEEAQRIMDWEEQRRFSEDYQVFLMEEGLA